MKQFLALMRKEFLHIFRDTWTMVILLLLPVVMLVLFGYALNTDVRNTAIAVCDPSRDETTSRIVDALERSGYFRVERTIASPDEIEAVFREGKIELVVTFGDRFGQRIGGAGGAQISIVADGTDPNTALSRVNYATGIINTEMQKITGQERAPYAISTDTRLLYNPEMKSAYNFVPGVMGMILMLICAMMTSISIVREKETGSMEVLLASPMRPLLIILAKAIPYLILSCVNLATILVLAVFMLGVPIAGSLAALIVTSLAFILVALSLGLLISTVAETQLVALLLSALGLLMPVMILSGMMYPVDNMPIFLQVISRLLPASWYISAIRKIMIQGLGFASVARELGILAFMGTALITVSLLKFKVRLE